MNVGGELAKILQAPIPGICLHGNRLVSSLEKMAFPLKHRIDPLGKGPLKPFHPDHQVGLRSLQEQVVVVGHQAIGMYHPARLLADFRKGGQEQPSSMIIKKDVLSIIAPGHGVVVRSRIFNSEGSWHFGTVPDFFPAVNVQCTG